MRELGRQPVAARNHPPSFDFLFSLPPPSLCVCVCLVPHSHVSSLTTHIKSKVDFSKCFITISHRKEKTTTKRHPLEPLGLLDRCRTPTHTPGIPTPLLQPLACAHVELALQVAAGFLAVDEVAEPTADAALAAVETAAGFAEVGHGGEFAVDRAAGVPARVEGVACFLRVFFVFESDVDIADEVCWGVWVSICFYLICFVLEKIKNDRGMWFFFS